MTTEQFDKLVQEKSLDAEMMLNEDGRLRWHIKSDDAQAKKDLKVTNRRRGKRACGCGPQEICSSCNPIEFYRGEIGPSVEAVPVPPGKPKEPRS